MTKEILSTINQFYKNLKSPKVDDHRYKSWEHCYSFFRELHNKNNLTEQDYDHASLILAFYLASWGMYRGSSFILQKDYTIFKEIAKELLNKRYSLLWDLKNNLQQQQSLESLFSEVYLAIDQILKEKKSTILEHADLTPKEKKRYNQEKVSTILLTKILLGTIGCIPAYDEFFKKGIKQTKKEYNLTQKFNRKSSLRDLLNFYKNNQKEIDSFEKRLYPPMKRIDMYFWQIGKSSGRNK